MAEDENKLNDEQSAAENTESVSSEKKEDKKPKDKPPFKERLKTFCGARKNRILLTALVSVALPLILFVSAPFDIYAHNKMEFVFSLSDFMPICIGIAFAFAVAIAALLYCVPYKAYKVLAAVFVSLSFMFFVQGTYLNMGMSALTGDNDGWRGGAWVGGKAITVNILNILLWAGVIAAAILLALKFKKQNWVKIGSLVLVAVVLATQFMNIMVTSVTDKDVYMSYAQKEAKTGKFSALTDKDIKKISNSNNIIYFLVDKFDMEYADDYYETDPELFDNLKGFTWFRDNVSRYSHTYPSVPYLLSGREYDSEVLREEFLDKVYKGDTPLKELYDGGYKINLFTQPYHAYNYNGTSVPDYVENFTEGSYKVKKKGALAIQMTRMSLYRGICNGLKIVVGGAHVSTANYCVDFYGTDGSPAHIMDNGGLYNEMQKREFTFSDDKNFSFIHMDGCHGTLIEKKLDVDRKPFVRASFKIINHYLDELKAKGLYNDATIIITGDHGRTGNNSGKIHAPHLTTLFFKRSGDTSEQDFKISDAPVCHEDIWPTIMKSAGADSKLYEGKKTLYDYAEGEERSRWFVQHTYQASSFTRYFYEIKGGARDWRNWHLHDDMTKHYKRHLMD